MTERPRPWVDAWSNALYGERGFYRRDEGPAGHFATSAQGIPGVADVLAQTVLAYAERCAATVVVDFACGRGELLEAVARFAEPSLNLVGVDVVDRPVQLDARVGWVRSPGGSDVPDLDFLAGRRALVIAHEWLDVVPCVIAEPDDDGVLREVRVDHSGAECLGAEIAEPDREWAEHHWSGGHRVEIGRTRDAAWSALVESVTCRAATGSVVVGVDYGHTRESRPLTGTLTGFRDGAECSPVPDGSCDVTAHVATDSLDVDHVTTQRAVMLDLFGDAPLAPVPLELARTDPPAYLRRLAARSALGAAVNPDGLGAFHWFVREIR